MKGSASIPAAPFCVLISSQAFARASNADINCKSTDGLTLTGNVPGDFVTFDGTIRRAGKSSRVYSETNQKTGQLEDNGNATVVQSLKDGVYTIRINRPGGDERPDYGVIEMFAIPKTVVSNKVSSGYTDTFSGNRADYDPGWVYHGLLIGTPGDAVRFLHSLMSGDVLPPGLLAEMTACHPIGERPLPGRPWETTGYGLGLMIGRMASVGIAMGHSGASPGSVSAVYHFGDRPTPCTVGAFATGDEEGAAEHEVVRLARLA